ncbi:MAG: sulfate permease [Burkholderiaceae bacterium]
MLKRYLPILGWLGHYNRKTAGADLMAALIVTIMLIPQSLAYAMLAGLPPEMGIYASIVPIILYSIFGSSTSLAVGPVAVVSLLTASAISNIASPGSEQYITAALTLALLSGIFLLAMGLFRLGFIANFLSHPVIAGFITASAILIAIGQVRHLLGVSASGHNLFEIVVSLVGQLRHTSWLTLAIGASVVVFLFWSRRGMVAPLKKLGLSASNAAIFSRAAPVVAVAVTIVLAWSLGLGQHGVKLVGHVPAGLPGISKPSFSWDVWRSLALSAMVLSIIGFVESVSVAQTLAAKRQERIDPDQELVGLGAANIGAAFSGGFPVTGGFSRSVVNFDAGARTPAAGIFTAVGLMVAAVFLTPLMSYLPKATLAATIIVAVLSLVDLSILRRAWSYSFADFFAVAATIVITLIVGVEAGVGIGVISSLVIHLYRSSKPHIAVVGQVPGTEHYRNVDRHPVITQDHVLGVRVDESLYFPNARYLEDKIMSLALDRTGIRDVVLMCSAINTVDLSALDSLESINSRLNSAGISMHLSEVKGPVMDQLQRSDFLDHLTGRVFLSQHQATRELENKSIDNDAEVVFRNGN